MTRGWAWTGAIVAWFLRAWGGRIIMHQICETDTLQAFNHPRPSYPIHVLIVPKQAIRSLAAIEASQAELLGDVLKLVKDLVAELNLEEDGYRLIVNGGAYQEIPQLHFHLVSGSFLKAE